MKSVDLVQRTRQLVIDRPRNRPITRICRETGLSRAFVVNLQTGRTAQPRAPDVQKLYEYLTGKPLIEE